MFPAAAAGVLHPDVLNDFEEGCDVFQLLAGLLTDLAAKIVAAGTPAVFGGELVAALFAGEMWRQLPAAVSLPTAFPVEASSSGS